MNRGLGFAAMAQGPAGEVGGKALALGLMHARSLMAPETACVPAQVYREPLRATGWGARILLEVSRRPLAQMRGEELWEAALP